MEFRNTAEILHANAEEITRLIDQIEKADEIRTIELDLILEKLRDIYDLVLSMHSAISEKGRTIKKDSLVVEEEIHIIAVESKEMKSPEEKQKERKEIAREHIERDLKNEQLQHDISKSEKKSFVSDRFKTSKPTLNEELAGKVKPDEVSAQLKTKPLASITSGLGINEKFELIKELFEDDKDKFEQTMQVLNMAGSFVEAYSYLEEHFNWDMDNFHVQRILELIRRKLIVRQND